MSLFSFEINFNHIFFFLIFVSYFVREIVQKKLNSKLENSDYTFGNSKNSTRKLFNIYVYTLSNFISFFCQCIIKYRTKREQRNSDELLNMTKSSKDVQLIYSGQPINKKKLLKRTFFLTICDFFAQFSVFLLYFFINDDSKFQKKVKFDMLPIFTIITKYILSKILLRQRYYMHHYLSFAINIFCLIILASFELSEFDYSLANILYLLIRIFSQVTYSLEDVIGKMALIEEFLSPYTLLIYKGIYEIFILLICSFPFLFIKKEGKNIFEKMQVFIDNFTILFLYLILMILNFIYNIFIWIIIDRFSPNDYSMSTVIEGLTAKLIILIYDEKFNKSLFIVGGIIYIILIFGLCIFSEIIIINKCGLNEYTKKYIGNKGYEDYDLTRKTGIDFSDLGEEERKKNNIIERKSSKENQNIHGKLSINLNDMDEKSRSKSISSFSLQNLDTIKDINDLIDDKNDGL